MRLKSSLKLLNDFTEVFIPQVANSKFLLLSKYFTKITEIRKMDIIVIGDFIISKNN